MSYYDALLRRPLTLEIIAWELNEENHLTQILSKEREKFARRLFAQYGADTEDTTLFDSVAILAAGLSYLALRGRKIKSYAGLPLKGKTSRRRIEAALRLLMIRS
jgi:hypothetical protein